MICKNNFSKVGQVHGDLTHYRIVSWLLMLNIKDVAWCDLCFAGWNTNCSFCWRFSLNGILSECYQTQSDIKKPLNTQKSALSSSYNKISVINPYFTSISYLFSLFFPSLNFLFYVCCLSLTEKKPRDKFVTKKKSKIYRTTSCCSF